MSNLLLSFIDNSYFHSKRVPVLIKKRHSIIAFLLGFLPASYSMSIAKKIGLDIRLLWNNNRHYWVFFSILVNNVGINTILKLCLYYMRYPYYIGLPWGCAMESAYRLINLVALQDFLLVSKKNQKNLLLILRFFIKLEQKFILNNLELESQNNHYLMNLVGLAVLNHQDILYDEEWLLSELKKIFHAQFYDDGANFEASSAYHGLALEGIVLVAARNKKFKEWLLTDDQSNKLKNAFLFYKVFFSEKTNEMAYYGDNDSGYLYFDVGNSINGHKFQQFLFENVFTDLWQAVVVGGVIKFQDAGVVCISNKRAKLIVLSGGVGQSGKGGHSHNDKTSFIFWLDGVLVCGDPGVISYVHKRNMLRSTAMHSNILIANCEQNSLLDGAFKMQDSTNAKIEIIDNEKIVASHYGFKSILIKREFHLSENTLWVTEVAINNDKAKPVTNFCLSHYINQVDILEKSVRLKASIDSVDFCINFESNNVLLNDDLPYPLFYGDNETKTSYIKYQWVDSISNQWSLSW